MTPYTLDPIGHVESVLRDRSLAPRQADEGAPSAWLAFRNEVAEGLRDLRVGDQIVVITWLDRAERGVLTVHPRGDANRPPRGVFSTRSPDRPNPIGLHRVRITEIQGARMQVSHLEALHGTPILDVKPVRGHHPDD